MERTARLVKVLVTGACGFVGSTLLRTWVESGSPHELLGIDNLSRPGSETNRAVLRRLGVRLIHGDLRVASDLDGLPPFDALVDAAANPSVLSGVDGRTSSRQLLEHNLIGTVNMLEVCKERHASFLLLSTSRVYSIPPLATLPVRIVASAFEPDPEAELPPGLSPHGLREDFSSKPPTSVYGATKLASEQLALEYGEAFGFPVWVNRCGVMAGAGQFGRADQGVVSFWIHSWKARRALRYIGFDGEGHQVRDCLHPADLVPLLDRQLSATSSQQTRTVNVSGGAPSAFSLRQLSDWCETRFGRRTVGSEAAPRPFDIPWLVLDPTLAVQAWGFSPTRSKDAIFEEIALHAERNPEWLSLSEP